jgi:hypothetical protein
MFARKSEKKTSSPPILLLLQGRVTKSIHLFYLPTIFLACDGNAQYQHGCSECLPEIKQMMDNGAPVKL